MGNPPFEDVSPIKNGVFPFTSGYARCEQKGVDRRCIFLLHTFILCFIYTCVYVLRCLVPKTMGFQVKLY